MSLPEGEFVIRKGMAKYSLTKNAVMVLRSILQVPGACKEIDDIYRGGKILAVVLPEFKTLKDDTEGKEVVEFELDGPERDLCKLCLKHALGKEVVPASIYLYEIIEKLEFISK